MTADSAIILMAKQPIAGLTKTRLCPPMTFESAAMLYEALLKDTLSLAGGLEEVDLAVAISPPDSLGYFQSITQPGTLLIAVDGENIGVCLEQALAVLFERGYCKALALNTDGPSLPKEYLVQAVRLLDEADIVLGPGEDGGYYLVGMKQIHHAIFQDIPWSTNNVLAVSLVQAERLSLRAALTPPWYDIDGPADALRLQEEVIHLPADRLAYSRQFFSHHPFERQRL